MAKTPATVLGMIFRTALMAVFIIVPGHLWVYPTASIKVWAMATAAVLAPVVLLAIFQQIRLRRALSREKGS
ncbi:MAG: hypothetical protein ABSB13_15830 [Candidatus Binatus sp.]|jgi:hypothetical protein|uniref:hypothetical protein n=1 Tax=Candidatus Binatus sp. TaxID=2811406 RepID=UPI003D0FB1A4